MARKGRQTGYSPGSRGVAGWYSAHSCRQAVSPGSRQSPSWSAFGATVKVNIFVGTVGSE